ncbi:MAG: hypothetical protein IKQ44_14545 [Lachnospiraceae bacterium]|nr:hypothetical protein [Lachnospiraceae bacterium]
MGEYYKKNYVCVLNDEDELIYVDFMEFVKECTINVGKIIDICSECGWDYICQNMIKKRNIRPRYGCSRFFIL